MEPVDDSALLRAYCDNQSDDAFAELVTRHVNLVYSVALRQVGNTHQAEDIAQAVFIILAQKARTLRHERALSSWLFRAAHLTANNLVRSERRRHRREQEAHMQSLLNEPDTGFWEKIAPLLDTAVADLNEQDRRAIVLRFYERRSLRDVGMALALNEETAKKRVARALDKLQNFFSGRGIHSSAETIAETISANSVQAAPVALAKTVTAMALAKGTTASVSTATLIKGALKIMAWTKAKTSIAVAVVLIVATSSTVVAVKQIKVHRENKIIAAFVEKNDNSFGEDERDYQKIKAMGSAAVPFLIGYIEKYNSIRDTQPNPQSGYPPKYTSMRIRAYWGLGGLHSAAKSAIPFLIQQFNTTNDLLDFDGDALAGFGKDAKAAVPTLVNALHSSNQQFQWEGAYVLAQIDPNNAELLPLILAGMKNPDAVNRRFACLALGEMGTNAQPVLSVLTNALQDEDEWVRKQAAKALEEINSAAGQAK